jgi:hypothetical protein
MQTNRACLLMLLGRGYGCATAIAMSQTSSCLTSESGSTAFIGQLRRLYSNTSIDSSTWKQQGFPFATGNAIALVTNDSTCAVGAEAYLQAGGRQGVTQAFVAAIGTTGYVVAPPSTGPGVLYWFDSNWTFKQRAQG